MRQLNRGRRMACRSRHGRAAVFAALVFFGHAAAYAAGTYKFVMMRTPQGQEVLPAALNDHDQIVGNGTYDGETRGFVWQKGMFTENVGPGTSFTLLSAINASGIAAGVYSVGVNVDAIFTYDLASGQQHVVQPEPGGYYDVKAMNRSGKMVGETQIARCPQYCGYVATERHLRVLRAPLPDARTFAYDLNDSGVVVGEIARDSGDESGFLFHNNTYTIFDAPGAHRTVPVFINNDGVLGGSFSLPHLGVIYHGFVTVAGTTTQYDYPGAKNTNVIGYGPGGAVYGNYVDDRYREHGFVDIGGTYYPIDIPRARQTYIIAVNAQGSVVGGYIKPDNRRGGFFARCGHAVAPCTP